MGKIIHPSMGAPSIKPKNRLHEADTRLFDNIAEEVIHGDRDIFDALTEHERNTVLDWMSDALVDGNANNALHDLLWEIDFLRKPVTVQEFITNDYYFGKNCRDLHDNIKQDLDTVFALGSPIQEWILTGSIGWGKGLPVDEPVLTPKGWKRNGDLKVGDRVIGSNGTPTRVTGVFPRGRIPAFKVRFDDGAEVVVDGDHLWNVQSPGAKYHGLSWKTISTTELIKRGVTKGKQKRWHIPVLSGPVQYAPAKMPMSAYALGALLGDGGLTGGSVRFSSNDAELIEDVCCETGMEWRHVDGCDYRIVTGLSNGVTAEDRRNPLLGALRSLDCCKLSQHKRIPDCYLRASVKDRIEMLRGLMDTDGWYERGARFSTSSPGLADDMVELVRSLGGIAYRALKRTTHLDAHTLYVVTPFNPFRLRRKAEAWRPAQKYGVRRMIADIQPVEPQEIVCIQVEAADQLYVVKDFIVTHNTTAACAGIGYKNYFLTCLKDPAKYYGLLPGSAMFVGIYSITKRQVYDAGYGKLHGWLESSMYFREQATYDEQTTTRVKFDHTNLSIVTGSTAIQTLGTDLFSFMMDEANFMHAKTAEDGETLIGQAYEIYNSTISRLTSRYVRPGGTLPGIAILLSSSNGEGDFLDQRMKKVAGTKVAHVSNYRLWETKAKSDYATIWDLEPPPGTPPKFRVMIGDRVSRSRILRPEEQPRDNAKVIWIPGEVRKQFEEDVDQSLRDIAGIATFNLSPLISDRASIFDAVRTNLSHPFREHIITLGTEEENLIEDSFMVKHACRVIDSKWVPRLNPGCPRYIHGDLAVSRDAIGLAMCHMSGFKRIEKMTADGTKVNVEKPIIMLDFMLRIVAPPGQQMDYSKIRSFILYLRKFYNIDRVTFDSFQSVDMIQILHKQGMTALGLSMDLKEDPYLGLRNAHYERRIVMYEYEPYIDEMLDLQRNLKKHKIDHPQKNSKGGKGSKDVADAVAGCVHGCLDSEVALKSAPAVGDESEIVSKRIVDPMNKGQLPLGQRGEETPKPIAVDAPSNKKVINGIRTSMSDLRKNLKP